MIAYTDICDENQLDELKKLFGIDNELEAIQMAVKATLKKQTYDKILNLCGKVKWEGNLDEMRQSRP